MLSEKPVSKSGHQVFSIAISHYALPVFLIALVIARHVLYLKKAVLPFNDSLYVYEGFHFLYNEFTVNKALPLWMPYVGYGIDSNLIFHHCAGAAHSFAGLIGWLLRAKDTLLLYNLAMILEELIFVMGLFLVAKHNLKYQLSIFFVCSAAALSLFIDRAPFLHFQTFFSLPITLYLLQIGFENNRFSAIVGALLVFCLSLLGGLAYTATIGSIPIVIATVSFAIKNKIIFRTRPAKWDVFLALGLGLVLLFFSACYLVLAKEIMTQGLFIAPSRNKGMPTVDLQTFLHYATVLNFDTFLDVFMPHTVLFSDTSIFAGLSTVLFLCYALFTIGLTKRSFIFYLWVSTVIVLILLACGPLTPVASIMYFIYPGMRFYRGLRFIVTYWIVFAPLIAGYGMDLFADLLAKKMTPLWKPLMLCIVVFHVVEMASFQINFQSMIAKSQKPFRPPEPSAYQISPTPYLPARSSAPPTARAKNWFPMTQQPDTYPFAAAYQFFDWDPCDIIFRLDYINPYVQDLRKVFINPKSSYHTKRNQWLTSIGCESSKLRFVGNARVLPDYQRVMEAMTQTADMMNTAFLTTESGEHDLSAPTLPQGAVTVTKFSANRLEADVQLRGRKPAWLFYADAWTSAWRASVDNVSVPVLRTNYAFKSIKVEPGDHKIVFEYHRPFVMAAKYILIILGIAAVSAFLFLVLLSPALMAVTNPFWPSPTTNN